MHDKREFLQCRDHDPRFIDEGLRELLRILVDCLGHTLDMLDLVDGILKLAVEDAAICDDNDAIENLLVGGSMQAREAV